MFNFTNKKTYLKILFSGLFLLLSLVSFIIAEIYTENKLISVISGLVLFSTSLYGLYTFYLVSKKSEELNNENKKIELTKHKFENLFYQSLTPTLIVDHNLTITDKNQAYIEIFGDGEDSLLNYIVNNNSMSLYSEILKNLEKNKKFEFNFEILSKSSERKYFVANLNPYESNNKIFYLATFIDKTDSILKNEQFKKIAESAIEVSKKKSEFMANMSHELRTPLNGIIGLSDTLLDTVEDKEARDSLSVIYDSGQILLQLINNILDFSKLEADKVELEQLPFSLHDLLNSVTYTLKELAKRKEIDLMLNIDPKLEEYYVGDKVRLTQVFFNLVGNAIKFTEKGHVEISAKKLNGAHSKDEIEFSIIDTGIGMNNAAKEKLFEAFSQADSSISRKFGGTGLGLSISKKIVNLYESNIKVDSQEGKGSSFSFILNLTIAHDLQRSEEIASRKDLDISSIPLNILVAEDNKVNQLVAKKMFSKIGYEIEIAENGKEAYEKAIHNNYDVIFMDMQMPEMNGIDATKKILSEMDFFNAPIIIAMTANTDRDDKQACFDVGMSDFISKPIQISKLKEKIYNHFKQLDKSA